VACSAVCAGSAEDRQVHRNFLGRGPDTQRKSPPAFVCGIQALFLPTAIVCHHTGFVLVHVQVQEPTTASPASGDRHPGAFAIARAVAAVIPHTSATALRTTCILCPEAVARPAQMTSKRQWGYWTHAFCIATRCYIIHAPCHSNSAFVSFLCVSAQKGFKDNTHTSATRHPRLPTPSQHNLTFCAPHAHPLLPSAMAFVSYGFV
jgi:hypothetical protein